MLLAEIADKMSSVASMWMNFFLCGAGLAFVVTLPLTVLSKWIGLIPVLLTAWISITIAGPQGGWDDLVVREMGAAYLYHSRASGMLPFVWSLVIWLLTVFAMKKRAFGKAW